MFLRILAILISAITISHAEAFSSKLVFDDLTGAYFVDLLVGGNQRVLAMVDTGSSDLVLVGDNALCPSCIPINGEVKRVHFPKAVPDKKQVSVYYGDFYGQITPYDTPVFLSQSIGNAKQMVGILRAGAQVKNLLGMAYDNDSSIANNRNPTFFRALNAAYGLDNQFSVLFCPEEEGGTLFWGPLPKPYSEQPVAATVPIVKQQYYTITHLGVWDKNKKPIIKTPQYKVILDTGTTADLQYSARSLKPIINYLWKNTSKKNRALPLAFWEGKLCVKTNEIDAEHWPDLQLSVRDEDGSTKFLPLDKYHYITHHGCGKSYYKLAFTVYAEPTEEFDGILGGPFLNQYLITFKRGPKAQVVFRKRGTLCQIT